MQHDRGKVLGMDIVLLLTITNKNIPDANYATIVLY